MTTSARPRVYLDTNVLLSAHEGSAERVSQARIVLEAIDAGSLFGVTSRLTLAELLPKPIATRNEALTSAYEDLVGPRSSLSIIPVDAPVLVTAARLRASTPGLKLPDAIHCATALLADCAFVVTGDRRLPRDLGFEVIALGPDTLERIRTATP